MQYLRAHRLTAQRGFVALISAAIISAVLLSLALAVGGGGVSTRFDVLQSEYKRVSLALAESCANVALLKIAQDYDYAGDESSVALGTDGQGREETCAIGSVTYAAGATHDTVARDTAVFIVHAAYPPTNGAHSTLRISASIQNPKFATAGVNISINSWFEVP